MQVNNISSMAFRANVSNIASEAAQSAVSRASRQIHDVVISSGEDSFMAKNVAGQPVKITSILDAVRAMGIKVDDTPLKIKSEGENFIKTPLGNVTCLEDAVKLSRKF